MKVFLDIYLALNFGDDLFLDIILRRYPNITFITNYTGNLYEEFFKKYPNVKKRNYKLFHKILRRLKIYNHLNNFDIIAKECNCAIFLGGSIFRDEPYHTTLYKERNNIMNSFLKYNKKVFVIGSNFGPIVNNSFYLDYYNFFKKCEDVCFRDNYSLELFSDLKNIRKASDIVFNLDIKKYKKDKKKKIIGYSIIDFRHKFGFEKFYDNYIENIVESIKTMSKKGYKCEILSFCEKEGDLEVAKEINRRLIKEEKYELSIYNYLGNIQEVIEKISTYEYFIAGRFHANILGMLLGVKLCPLIYNQKTLNLLNDLEYNGKIITTDNLYELSEMKFIKNLQEYKLNEKIIIDAKNQFLKLDIELGRV